MKKLTITFIIGFMASVAFGQTNILDLERIEGVWREVGESSPFSGDFIEKFANGKVAATGTFKNGLLDGQRIVYNANGDTSLIRNYRQGILNGVGKDFYDNGALRQEGLFKDGKEHGAWTMYYESGEKLAILNVVEGVQQGRQLQFSKEGSLVRQFYAIDGKAGYSEEFNKQYRKAEELRIQLKVKKGIELYNKAIEINPTVAKAYFGRGECKGYFDFEGAIKDYTKAIELQSDYMEAYRNRGTAKINVYTSKGTLNPTTKQTESACYDLFKAKELGDDDLLSNTLITEHCKKHKKKK